MTMQRNDDPGAAYRNGLSLAEYARKKYPHMGDATGPGPDTCHSKESTTMQRNDDPATYREARLNTPLGGPDPKRVAEAHRHNDPDMLLDCPGTCLKSVDRDGPHGFPKHYGVLVTYDVKSNYVLVRGHNSPVSPACTWTGTVDEYRAMWKAD